MTRHSPDDPISAADPLDRNRYAINDWKFTETEYSGDDLGVTESLFAVGNGYLGMRGNVEEGRVTFAHGTFINGFHETWPIRHAEEAFGFARVGQTIVNVPDNKTIKLYVDDEPMLLAVADLESYERSLDFRDGLLRRNIVWRTPGGKRVKVSSTRMVSFTQRHLAIMTMEVTMLDEAAPVVISSQTLNRQDGRDEYHVRSAAMGAGVDPRKGAAFEARVLEPQSHWWQDQRIILGYRCANSKMTLAVGVDHQIMTDNDYRTFTSADEDTGKMVYRVQAKPGQPIKVTKVVAYHTSRGVPSRELVDRCRRTLDRVRENGVEPEFADQREWLDRFWERSDVVVHGQPALQQAIRWNLFQLAQATARAEQSGVPARGMTGTGDSGHYSWDTEIFVLPFLSYTSPQMARSELRFRYNMLGAARRRAKELAENGALFPWRTIMGEEASAEYPAGTAQYHIDADIAYALCKYGAASGDQDFMNREGVDILVETARLWADLGSWSVAGGTRTFHINRVTGPDEYTTMVNDNLFTNVMARFNLARAAELLRRLKRERPRAYRRVVERLDLAEQEIDDWAACAEAMTIPYDHRTGINPQDSHFLDWEVWDLKKTPRDQHPLMLHFHPLVISRFQVLSQADVVLALFLQGDQFSHEAKRSNFEYYDPITTGDSPVSGMAQSIIAAEVGYRNLALHYFYKTLFVDLADLHGNTSDGIHIACSGAVWSTLAYGFGGMRDYNGVISFDPRLPTDWEKLTFPLAMQGTRLRVDLTATAITFTVEDGDQAIVLVRGREVTVAHGEPATVTLDHQGPRIEGIPTVPTGERVDGSVIRAMVPEPEARIIPFPRRDTSTAVGGMDQSAAEL
jgi:alpha,alpha-trehalose phosphorylase